MKQYLLLLTILLGCIFNLATAQNTDTLKLFYDIDVSTLNNTQKLKIDSIINKWRHQFDVKVSINGFTDYLGSDDYNKNLSIKRADNVKIYIARRFNANMIINSDGRGKLPPELKNNPVGILENRKIELVVYSYPIPKENEDAKPIDKSINEENIIAEPEVKLTDLNVGEHFILKNLNFYPGRHIPMPEALQELENLVIVMQEHPNLEIEIQGHICCVSYNHDCYDYGTKKKNLSKERAKLVYNYLIDNGIEKSRLSYKGYGGRFKLIKMERTESDRLRNRRVEIKIVSK